MTPRPPPGAPAAGLGGDDHRAARRPRSVEGRRVGALQDTDHLDVRGIDVAGGVSVVDASKPVIRRGAVVDRYAVDHEEGLVVVRNRARAPDHDPGGSSGRPRVRDLEPRHGPLEGVHDVDLGHAGDLGARDVLDRVAERPPLTPDPERGDRETFDPDGLLEHLDIDPGRHRDLLGAVSETAEGQRLGVSGHTQAVEALCVRDHHDHGPPDGDGNAGQRLAGLPLDDGARHRALLSAQCSRDQEDSQPEQPCQTETLHGSLPRGVPVRGTSTRPLSAPPGLPAQSGQDPALLLPGHETTP